MAALDAALDKTLETHSQRLATLQEQAMTSGNSAVERLTDQARRIWDSGKEQQIAIGKLVQGVAAHVQAMTRLQAGEEQLARLQEALNHNLSALHAAGTLDQAVHSLTAAIHLLTTRADSSRARTAA